MDTAQTVKQFIAAEFLSDATADELPADYDLLANGVIESLDLLKLIDWLEAHYGISIDDVEIAPENFRTVDDIVGLIGKSPALTRSKAS